MRRRLRQAAIGSAGSLQVSRVAMCCQGSECVLRCRRHDADRLEAGVRQSEVGLARRMAVLAHEVDQHVDILAAREPARVVVRHCVAQLIEHVEERAAFPVLLEPASTHELGPVVTRRADIAEHRLATLDLRVGEHAVADRPRVAVLRLNRPGRHADQRDQWKNAQSSKHAKSLTAAATVVKAQRLPRVTGVAIVAATLSRPLAAVQVGQRQRQDRNRNASVTMRTARLLVPLLPALAVFTPSAMVAQDHEVVIANGRVIDPESGLDAVRHIGIRGGVIVTISDRPLSGGSTIDAAGLVVAPGFIDLHVHGHDEHNYGIKALDGVTTALELEVGAADIAEWYAARADRARINFGASIGHIKARMAVFGDAGAFLPSGEGGRGVATDEQIEAMKHRLAAGLAAGALGIGMGIQYTPGATRHEILEMFRVAARWQAPVFVHVRAFGSREPGSSVESFLEVIGAAALTGAPLHIVHLNSMSLQSTPQTLRIVEEAQARGIDVTTEAYPYSAGMTRIESALLDQYVDAPDSVYAKMQWVKTGERLTRASFQRYRGEGGAVILHLNSPAMEALAITSPLTAIASDGSLAGGQGHPRQAGTFARVLGHYVRETGQLALMEALRKMTLLPARRLEAWAPAFQRKGRIREGADADIVVFDPATVRDRSTYAAPALSSEGFVHVLVNGEPVVRGGRLVAGAVPGRAVRAPVR